MGLPLEKHCYTIAEYLTMEEKSETKNEFHDGENLSMAGGTYHHSRLITNLVLTRGARLKGSPCYMLESNMRVRIAQQVKYVYPDAMTVCGPPQFDPNDPKQTTILNPRVVFEVLSDSTANYDRGEKFAMYRDVPSMEEFVIVAQHTPRIEIFTRQPDGDWRIMTYSGLDATARLLSMDIDLPLAEVYAGIDLTSAT